MRVADYIADYIYSQQVRQIFMVSGGGMMFLSDALAVHPGLKAICAHHEQAAAMAAVAYAKYKNDLGVCYVTTGCGGTNAITGLLNGWQDSTPCLFISGQSKRKETVRNSGLKLRQFGVQEVDIVSIVEPLTKYAVMVNEPELIPYHLEKAVFLARNGRRGPVWLDVPMDVQGAEISPIDCRKFDPSVSVEIVPVVPRRQELEELSYLIHRSERPIILAGQGIRQAGALEVFRRFIEKFNIPVVVSKLAVDVLPTAHDLYVGGIGNKGTRGGNFALQNSDLVISLGCRLSVSSTGHEYANFARQAQIVVIDIDPVEHQKGTVRIDKFIHSDAKLFLDMIVQTVPPPARKFWLEKCLHWKRSYPVCLPVYANEGEGINLYHFVDSLCKVMPNDAVVVWDAGSALYAVTQAAVLREGQRLIGSGGQAEMGFTLPATVGVSFARDRKDVIGITGDGSFQMNLQELQTIKHHNLPIKMFVWNNDGYLSIRASQGRFFEGRFIGTDSSSGVSFPDLEKIAAAYDIKYVRISSSHSLGDTLSEILALPGPVLCEVICLRDQEIVPTVASARKDDGTMVSKPLEDMYPFLPRDEFYREMIIPPILE
jgi:acetolactate synthase-1/2/3 large subunit